jgi:hypothetical protein
MRCGALLVTTIAAGALASAPSPALAAGAACAAAAAPVAHVELSAETRRAVASYKAAHDTLHLPAGAAAPTHARTPRPAVRSAGLGCAASASDRVVLANLNQQGQVTNYYCGPATVSEMAATRGAPVDQSTSGGWMGTDPNTGTNVDQLVRGLNHFVGDPGGGSYGFVSLSYNPTADERAGFVSKLRSNLTTFGGWPVAGDAWEVPGGPHLVGHPDVEIFHWIEIGGLGDGDTATYYADSATTVWSGVPAYSWIDTQAMVTILGGRGYAW